MAFSASTQAERPSSRGTSLTVVSLLSQSVERRAARRTHDDSLRSSRPGGRLKKGQRVHQELGRGGGPSAVHLAMDGETQVMKFSRTGAMLESTTTGRPRPATSEPEPVPTRVPTIEP